MSLSKRILAMVAAVVVVCIAFVFISDASVRIAPNLLAFANEHVALILSVSILTVMVSLGLHNLRRSKHDA